MTLIRLAFKNTFRNAFRSSLILLCAALVAGGLLAVTIIVQGGIRSLSASLERLGADILVAPWGTYNQRDELQAIRLMGTLSMPWMPEEFMPQLAAVPGIEKVSPQLYLTSIPNSPYTAQPFLHLMAYQPETDFVLRPWLENPERWNPGLGEAVGGSAITAAIGDEINIAGYSLKLVNRLEPTSTETDQALFVTFPTAQEMARQGQDATIRQRAGIPGRISAVLVRVELDRDPQDVYVQIIKNFNRVKPMKSTDMLMAERRQLVGLTRSQAGLFAVITVLAILFVGLVFSLIVNERRQEIGVFRALGATRALIVRSLLLESAILALAGGLAGLVISSLGFLLLRPVIMRLTGIPFEFGANSSLATAMLGCLALALVSVFLATLYPAIRISQQEAALTMRE